jgi:hypothetical protein
MSAQVAITQLPTAGAITGTEAVPIVQNGVTVQTTTGAIAGSPTQTYTYLTVNQTPQLPNSRYVGVTNGLVITDGGAQGLFNISTTGALLSLVNSGTGFQVKTSSTAITGRSIAVTGTGLAISNGDGIAGNPTIALAGQVLSLANLSANGLMTITTGGVLNATYIQGVADQIGVVNGDGVGGYPTISIADNPTLPGTGAMIVPKGTSAQQPLGVDGKMRFNTDTGTFDGYASGSWRQFSLSGGVISFSAGTTGFTPAAVTSGAIVLGGTLNAASGGTGANTLTGYVYGNGTNPMTASTTIPNTNITGLGTMSTQNANAVSITGGVISSVAITGSSIDGTLIGISGASSGVFTSLSSTSGALNGTIGATTPSTGAFTTLTSNSTTTLNGTTIPASKTLVDTDSSQTLTNKSMSGSANTFTNLPNSAFTNNSITIGSTTVALGGTITTFAGTSISGSTNTLTNIANASLTNSAITINGSSVSLGASVTVTATATNALTIGTGLTGTSYNGSTPVTIAIDSTVATLTGTQTLTNKTIDSPTINTPTIATPAITGGTINNTAIGGTTPAAGAFTSVAMTSGTIVNAPVNGTDIVNKQYADAIASGIHFHEAVELATTTALPANTYNNGASGVGATLTANANGALSVDSTLTVVGNRILVKNEVTQANNGVYVVTQVGSAGTPYILTRATDFDTAGTGVDQIDEGDFFLVTSGVANLNTAWVQQTAPPIVVGTTPLVFQQFAAPLVYSAGTGLNESPAYTFNIANTAVVAGSYGLAASVPTISINAQGQITSASNTAIAIAASQVTSGTLAIAQGGTNSSATPTAGGAVYGTGTAFAFTAAGTAGQVLTSAGAGAPVWSGISGGTF